MQLSDGSLATEVKAIGSGGWHSVIIRAVNSEVRTTLYMQALIP